MHRINRRMQIPCTVCACSLYSTNVNYMIILLFLTICVCMIFFTLFFYLTCFIYQHHNIISLFPWISLLEKHSKHFFMLSGDLVGTIFQAWLRGLYPAVGHVISSMFRKSKFRNLIEFVTKSCFCYSSTDSETR